MRKTALIIAIVISAAASAADLSRCGTDQFGNTVCLDQDGVLSTHSAPVAGEGTGAAASAVSETESNAKRDETKSKLRCGIDPFGNKVCQ